MRNLDETDMEILGMLAEDARRPYSEIAEEVGLSGPAVSDRVKRLQDAGIINRFTIDVNSSQLRAGVPVFVELDVPTGDLSTAREQIEHAEAVEHVFVTANGDLWFYARAQAQGVRQWIENLLEETPITDYTVTLMEDAKWTPSLDGTEFALTCAECNNTVDSEGRSTRLDDEVYHFCCPSCESQFVERYERLEEGA